MLTLLTPHPAALIEAEGKRIMVIADPHLGWEMSLQEKGIHVPSQSNKIAKKLVDLLAEIHPDALLILGDVKYTVMKSGMGEWQDVPQFFNELKKHVREVGIVRGNHDANLEPMLPEGVALHPASGIAVGEVGVFHGHKWPSPELLGCKTWLMGHVHPVVVLRDPAGFKLTRQIWMKASINPEALAKVLLAKHNVKVQGSVAETLEKHYGVKAVTEEVFIMPSFNDFLGGRPVNETKSTKAMGSEELIGPVVRSAAVDVGNAELYLLDGTYLGTLNQVRELKRLFQNFG
jgi:putative SbcD/Mre11-related phosphoesterase